MLLSSPTPMLRMFRPRVILQNKNTAIRKGLFASLFIGTPLQNRVDRQEGRRPSGALGLAGPLFRSEGAGNHCVNTMKSVSLPVSPLMP